MKSDDEKMELIRRYLSGEGTSEQVASLDAMMRDDPQLRSDFLAYARVDAALPKAIIDDAIPSRPNRRWLLTVPFVGIAVMILCAICFSSASIARFGELKDCRWVAAETRVKTGDSINSGQRIELSSGTAEVLFHTGAKLTIIGPAIFEPRSENSGFLTLGEVFLVAETPESKGFTIETPISKFIDIGTAFTATVSPDGLSRLDVSEGEVDVVLDGSKPLRFRRGETVFVEPGQQRVITRIESGDQTPAFQFPTIAPPSRDDYADKSKGKAAIKVATGELRERASSSGPATVLLDGMGQTQQDAPNQSAFFKTGTQGSFLIDLGKPIAISKINSYSWHQHNRIEEHRERATQRFILYGYAGDVAPEIGDPSWKRIARVNSDRFFKVNERLDRPAQQACSITAAKGEIGCFRYLLWEVKLNTFYGEIDIFGKPIPARN